MSSKSKSEVVRFRSPAEFFAENQNIAGFDNPGKALYTTIRELVENSLDAAESASVLPDISLSIEEMDTKTFEGIRGIAARQRVDTSLYHGGAPGGKSGRAGGGGASKASAAAAGDAPSATPAESADGEGGGGGGRKGGADPMYYRITCRDNGCGMPHERIPDMLGRVLAGSKYGVRQTRGKFGLGAKMALIWAKKSTGREEGWEGASLPTHAHLLSLLLSPPSVVPIEVTSAHLSSGTRRGGVAAAAAGAAADAAPAAAPRPIPAKVTKCTLDIDIEKNVPQILEHTLTDNAGGWIGSQLSVVISGAWSAYKSTVMRYFQQLAVITPYANLSVRYANVSAGASGKANFCYEWKRRSCAVPRPPPEVRHHPGSLNDLLLKQLIDRAVELEKGRPLPLVSFLSGHLASVPKALAQRLVAELGGDFGGAVASVAELSTKQVHQLARLLSEAQFEPPPAGCLSPAGEYNLRLGILKELRPDLVATHSSPAGVHEGHAFVVEAGVALGGVGPSGVTVYRFANRIPLLFEGGNDVATKTAVSRVPWSSYKIDVSRDKVGVFVSLVSTRIPFKGTGKEYIGDDIPEIRDAVKSALQACCAQLRVKLLLAAAKRQRAGRKKLLVRYIPDVCRAVLGALKSVSTRYGVELSPAVAAAGAAGAGAKRKRTPAGSGDEAGAAAGATASIDDIDPARRALLTRFAAGELNEALLSTRLNEAVEKADLDAALDEHAGFAGGIAGALKGGGGGDDDEGGGAGGGADAFIAPLRRATLQRPDAGFVAHPHCVIQFLPAAIVKPGSQRVE